MPIDKSKRPTGHSKPAPKSKATAKSDIGASEKETAGFKKAVAQAKLSENVKEQAKEIIKRQEDRNRRMRTAEKAAAGFRESSIKDTKRLD